LAPNESWTLGFQFVVAPSIQNIEAALVENHRPLAIGIPGYVLPKDIHAQLFLRYPERVKSIDVEPQAEHVADMGRFLTHEQWFDDPKDPFHRGPSAMTYDREANHIVTQD